MYKSQRSEFFLNKDYIVTMLRLEIEHDKMVYEYERFKSTWEKALNSSEAVAELLRDNLTTDQLVDMGEESMPDNPNPCGGCYKDHDGWACPNIY